MKKYIFQDGGISPTAVIVEKGEVIKDLEGNIFKISSHAPSHDSTKLVTSSGIKTVKKREAGVLLEDVSQVLSASQEQINSGDRKDKLRDDIVALTKEEANELAEKLKVAINVKKDISPSKAFTLIKDEKDKFLKKLEKNTEFPESVVGSNPYAINSAKANISLAKVLPTDEEVFDTVFEKQESSKEESGVDFEQKEELQLGGKLFKYIR